MDKNCKAKYYDIVLNGCLNQSYFIFLGAQDIIYRRIHSIYAAAYKVLAQSSSTRGILHLEGHLNRIEILLCLCSLVLRTNGRLQVLFDRFWLRVNSWLRDLFYLFFCGNARQKVLWKEESVLRFSSWKNYFLSSFFLQQLSNDPIRNKNLHP